MLLLKLNVDVCFNGYSIMPPRSKSKVGKALKENFLTKSTSTFRNKASKPDRKVLADKTNSLSDNNTSIQVTKTASKVSTKVTVFECNARPRRERRLPTRYVENPVLNNLSNSKDSGKLYDETTKNQQLISDNNENQTKSKSKAKHFPCGNQQNNRTRQRKNSPRASETSISDSSLICDKSTKSSFKSPSDIESCAPTNRPKRIHRLPSRFDEHSESPSKFLPILPSFASTPLQQKELKNSINGSNKLVKKNNSPSKSSPDTNNNPKKVRAARKKVDFKKFFSPSQTILENKNSAPKVLKSNRITNKNQSVKVLLDKQSKENQDGVDVYEFTYDPDEEPLQKKTKKKRVVKKKPPKPKFIIFKNNYEQNLSKTLNSLKKVVSNNLKTTMRNQKPTSDVQNKNVEKSSTKDVQSTNNLIVDIIQGCPTNPCIRHNHEPTNLGGPSIIQNNRPVTDILTNQQPTTMSTTTQETADNAPRATHAHAKNTDHQNKSMSIRVEDIAADFELSDNHDDINYSSVNSPIRPVTPNINFHTEQRTETIEHPVDSHDPLNLQDNISFFKEHPAASSSMNLSGKHPLASPWRVEFENLPIKWQVNTYVKPNMTPAVESSFISSKDNNKKKHVYTNMLLQSSEILPEKDNDNTSLLKQTSIISFMKEVAEKSATKKKRALSVTPTKANSLFEDITNISMLKNQNSVQKIAPKDGNVLIQNKKASKDKENIRDNRKRKNEENIEAVPAKSPRRKEDKDLTYFGFDDSENQDNENVSPKKVDSRVRALRPRGRAVLQEINGQVGPTRANLPLAAKSKMTISSEAANKIYEGMKSAEVAPTFENRNNLDRHTELTTADPVLDVNTDDADSNSVHLFEDIELIHHLKVSYFL